jgi:hypothetical protein
MNQTVDLHNHLIEACKNNDAKAQMHLYDQYCKAMCSIANRYVKDLHEAEDIMNTQLSSNSSGLKISELLSNVKISNKFGELMILDINSNAENCVLDLNFSEGFIHTKNGSKDFQILRANEINSDRNKDNSFGLSGNFSLKSKGIIITGKQSSIQIKKQ